LRSQRLGFVFPGRFFILVFFDPVAVGAEQLVFASGICHDSFGISVRIHTCFIRAPKLFITVTVHMVYLQSSMIRKSTALTLAAEKFYDFCSPLATVFPQVIAYTISVLELILLSLLKSFFSVSEVAVARRDRVFHSLRETIAALVAINLNARRSLERVFALRADFNHKFSVPIF